MLDRISLLDLRGYASLEASFGPGPHLVWGPNAAGKTSLLEAMVLLAWGRSHRTSADGEPGITVSANAEVGDHVGQVEASVEGDGTTIAFNARYLADVLTNVAADQFALELNGPLSPGVFKPVGDDHYIHVVMPVRTTS